VLGISNAIVDILAHVDEETLAKTGSPKGSMTLVDADRAQEIYALMGPTTEMSGGSVANTIANLAVLGGKTAYIGRVADDELGRIFIHDMRSLGVDMRMTPSPDGAPTARCHVLITPGGERTMQTYLGACIELNGDDANPDTIGTPEIILLEGYVWDIPHADAVIDEAVRAATENKNTRLAISLSDSFCVERHQEAFLSAVKNHAGLVFANEKEIVELFSADGFDAALEKAAALDVLFIVTRSEHGSVIVHGDTRVDQPAMTVDHVIDATGAGDAYTAGFLYAHTQGRDHAASAELGTRCATAVIQQIGARIDKAAVYGV
jgi:sugar/nucleoside kinase (ribokinase family)